MSRPEPQGATDESHLPATSDVDIVSEVFGPDSRGERALMFYTRPGLENHGLAYVLPWRVGKHVDGDVRPALLGYVSDESFQTEQVRLTLPEVRDLRRQHGGQLVDVELTPGWIHREREQAQRETYD